MNVLDLSLQKLSPFLTLGWGSLGARIVWYAPTGLLLSDWADQKCVEGRLSRKLEGRESEAEIFNCLHHVASSLLCSSIKRYSICLWSSSHRVLFKFLKLTLQSPIKSKGGNILQALWCIWSPDDLSQPCSFH